MPKKKSGKSSTKKSVNRGFSPKQDRQISHIKQSEQKRGMSAERAESIAYGTVVNQRKAKRKKGKKG